MVAALDAVPALEVVPSAGAPSEDVALEDAALEELALDELLSESVPLEAPFEDVPLEDGLWEDVLWEEVDEALAGSLGEPLRSVPARTAMMTTRSAPMSAGVPFHSLLEIVREMK